MTRNCRRMAGSSPIPPGRQIPDGCPLWQEREAGEWHIYVLAADGRTETEVTRTAGIDKQPMWSPDGTHLLFRSDRSGNVDLWALPIRDGKAIGPPLVVRRDIGAASNLGHHERRRVSLRPRRARSRAGVRRRARYDGQASGEHSESWIALPASIRHGLLTASCWSLPEANRWRTVSRSISWSTTWPPVTRRWFRALGCGNGPARWLGSTAFLQLVVNPRHDQRRLPLRTIRSTFSRGHSGKSPRTLDEERRCGRVARRHDAVPVCSRSADSGDGAI